MPSSLHTHHRLPCTLVLLTSTSQLPQWLEEHASVFEHTLIWHDAQSLAPAPQTASLSHAKVVLHPLSGNFAAHRNAAFAHIQSDWTLWIDQDETLTSEFLAEFSQALLALRVDALWVRRHDWFLGRKLEHGEVGSVRLLRAARTQMGKGRWQRAVHEIWNVPTSNAATLRVPIEHHPHPSFTAFLAKLARYAALEPTSRSAQPNWQTLMQFFLFPPAKFLHNYVLRGGWQDGWPGFVHAITMAYYSSITRVLLYEQYNKRTRS